MHLTGTSITLVFLLLYFCYSNNILISNILLLGAVFIKKFIIPITLILTLSILSSFLVQSNMSIDAFINLKSRTPYFIHCDLDECRMYVFKNNELIKKYSISGGKDSTRSPIGSWIITDKDRWGEGFGGRWMGFNVPWGRYGIHGTRDFQSSIGSNTSHGCIRMYNKDVAELYKFIPHGTRVTITQGLYGPFGAYYRMLKSGIRGADVYAVQTRLKQLGFFNGYVSGIYGKDLDYAINNFQKKNKLRVRNMIHLQEYNKLGFIQFE